MPFWDFKCPVCNKERARFLTKREHDTLCECGEIMKPVGPTDVIEFPHAQSRGKLYSKEIHSDSLAMSPTQVEEHKRKFPNIKIDSECRPVFDNFKDHDAYLEKTGFAKMPGKKKKRSRK